MKRDNDLYKETLEQGNGPVIPEEKQSSGQYGINVSESYKKPQIAMPDTEASVPEVKAPPSPAPTPTKANEYQSMGLYQGGRDYQADINKAVGSGNFAEAAELEKARNYKIQAEGLPYKQTYNFNYRSPYQNELEDLYQSMKSKEKFSYDPQNDESYIAMRKIKEKEADDAYKNAYARLAAQFGGEVPASMMGMLEKVRQDTIDSADAYIPQLKQMAYNMYLADKQDLYDQYNLRRAADAEAYGRWSDNRNMIMDSFNNSDARNFRNMEFDYGKERDTKSDYYNDRDFNYQVDRDAVNDSFREREFGFQQQQYINALSADERNLIMQMFNLIYDPKNGIGVNAAMREAVAAYNKLPGVGKLSMPPLDAEETPIATTPTNPTSDTQRISDKQAALFGGSSSGGSKSGSSGETGTKTESVKKIKNGSIDLNGITFVTLPDGKSGYRDKNGVLYTL